MSVQQLITGHLDIWTAAHKTRSSAGRGSSSKLDLVGIKKLRELILELAVRGKLVPQDPNDEPASELLKKIVIEKERLIKVGKVKREQPLGEIEDDEKLFGIPNGWVYARFGLITFNRDFQRVPLSVDERSTRQGQYDYYGASGVIDNIDDFIFDKPLMLIGEDGANLINRSTPIAFMAHGKYWVNNHAHVLDGISEEFLTYLCLYINSISLEQYVTGTAQPKMNQAKMNSIPVALPSEQEQHRIVTKVDELMAFCDQLEQAQTNNIAAHAQLVEALLATLVESTDHKQLQTNWQRLAAHFDTLFTTEHSINQLKQTILQLAVMGKLVPQNPTNEPASELLKKIAKEKEQLIKEGKIKKQKPLPEITGEEQPFELPEGWVYTRLNDICAWVTSGSTPPKTDFDESNGIPYLKVYNIRDQRIDFEYKPQFVKKECHERKLKRSTLYPGDVVMDIVGPPLGKIAIIPDTYPQWNCNQAIAFFRPINIQINSFLYTYLTAQIFLEYIELIGTAGQDNISVTKSRTIVFPFPPLAE